MIRLLNAENKSIESYIIIIFFFPTFWGFLGNGGISVGQILYSFTVFILGFIILFFRKLIFKFPNIYTNLFLLLLLSYSMTISFNSFAYGEHVKINDLTDLYRPVFYLLSISLGFSLYDGSLNLAKFIKFINYTILACSLFDLIKIIPGTRPLMNLYTHLEGLNFIRFSGTFCYCYNFVFVVLFGMLLVLFCEKRKKFLVSLLVLLIIFAGSRAGYIAFALSVVAYNFMSKKIMVALSSIIIGMVGTILIIVLLITLQIPLFDDIYSNVEKLYYALSGTGEDGSLMTRNSQLSRALENLSINPLWGVGPMKGTSRPIEIQLGYYLSSWGFIGTTIFLSIMVTFLRVAWKMRKIDGLVGNFSKANFVWLITAFIMGMSTPITDQIRVSQFFFLIQGLQYALYVQYKKNKLTILDH